MDQYLHAAQTITLEFGALFEWLFLVLASQRWLTEKCVHERETDPDFRIDMGRLADCTRSSARKATEGPIHS